MSAISTIAGLTALLILFLLFLVTVDVAVFVWEKWSKRRDNVRIETRNIDMLDEDTPDHLNNGILFSDSDKPERKGK